MKLLFVSLLFCLGMVFGACNSQPVTDVIISPEAVDQQTVTPRETETPEEQLPEILEPTPSIQINATPNPIPSLPSNWQLLGDPRFGLQLAAPQSWINMTGSIRLSEIFNLFGPKILLLVDSPETGREIQSGEPLSEGAFIFGFIDDSKPADWTPKEVLVDALKETGVGDESAISSLEINDQSAAMIDITRDPLNIFPVNQGPIQLRLVSVSTNDDYGRVIYLLGTGVNDQTPNFNLLMEIIESAVYLPVQSRIQGRVESGEPVHEILEKETTDLWLFNGIAGSYATISVTPRDSSVDLTLKLIDPDGKVLEDMDNGYAGDAELLTDVQLTAGGNYVVEVAEFFNEPASYELSLNLADEPQFGGGGSIRFGQEILAELPDNGEHLWVFDGTAGQAVTIILTALSDQLDLILEFRGPDGSELLLLDEGFAGDSEVLTGYELSVSGEYEIIVRGFAGRGGSYTLALDEGGESTVNFYDAGDISYGESRKEYLREDEAHAWFFEGEAGDEVTIEVLPLGANLDMDIWLLDPELQQVATKDELLSGEPEKIELSLPVNGQYLVLIREFFGEPGEYEVSLDVRGGNTLEIAGTVRYSQTITGTLPSGKQAGWTFFGRVDEVIDVFVTPVEADRDIVLVVLDPNGNTAASLDGSLAGIQEHLEGFRLTSDGIWTIVIQEFFNDGCNYELQLLKRTPEESPIG